MKKIIILAITIFNSSLVYPQNQFVCGTSDNLNQGGAILFSNCETTINYAPDENNLNHTPIKNVSITLHVFQRDDGTGNIPDNQTGRDWLNLTLVGYINGMMANMPQMQVPSTSPHIQDSRIHYVVDNIFFWQDDYGWDMQACGSHGSTLWQNYVVNNSNVINKYNTIHIFLGELMTGCDGVSDGRYIQMRNTFTRYQNNMYWFFAPTIAHELGHSLGLAHTMNFSGGGCGDDFDNCNDTPNHNCCWNLNEPPGTGCDQITEVTNNMMDYNACACALTECQLGIMHFSLMSGWQNDVLMDDYCNYSSQEKVTIASGLNIVWDSSRNLKGDIIIHNNASLTVQCTVSIPDGATAFVETGGSLIIDGGDITNICNTTVGPNFHVDVGPNSFMIIQGGSQITLKSGAILEIHENAQLTIKSGSTLIIEDGAELTAHATGLIVVEDGAELILQNQIAGKGLNIGRNLIQSNSAELRIEGTLSTIDNVNLSNNGYGFISIKQNGNLNLGNNSQIILNGTGATDLVLRITTNANHSTNGHDINITNGKIECVNNATLQITSGDIMHLDPTSSFVADNNSFVSIQSNGQFEFHEGCIGSFINGSRLTIEDNSELFVHRGGKVVIETGGELVYNNLTAGKGIVFGQYPIGNFEPYISINGTLSIANNADFTFSGNGYIIINHSTDKITTGTNSTMTFTGSSKLDKVLAVYNTLHADGLSLFKVLNGSIAGSGTISAPCPFTLINAKVYYGPTIKLYGQSQVTILGCLFEGGDPAIEAHYFHGGNRLTIVNNVFEGCLPGIRSYGGGITVKSCDFNDNYPGIEINNSSLPNFIENCTFINPIGSPLYELGTGVELNGGVATLFKSTIIKNHEWAVKANNSTAAFKCCTLTNNVTGGIYLSNGAVLNMSTYLNAGHNDLSGNCDNAGTMNKLANISLQNAGMLYLNKGYNELYLNLYCYGGIKCRKVIKGTLRSSGGTNPISPILWMDGTGPTPQQLCQLNTTCNIFSIDAYNNKWGSGTGSSYKPNKNYEYDLSQNCKLCNYWGGAGCKCTTTLQSITLEDHDPAVDLTCPVIISTGGSDVFSPKDPGYMKSPVTHCPTCPYLNTPSFANIKMNEAVRQALKNMELLNDGSGDDLTAINMFYEILTTSVANAHYNEAYLKSLSYSSIIQTFSNAVSNGKIPSSNALSDSYTQKVIAVIDTFLQKSKIISSEESEFDLTIDKAKILRIINERIESMQLLSNLSFCASLDTNETKLLNGLYKTNLCEWLVLSGEVPKENFDSLINLPVSAIVSQTGINISGNNNTDDTLPACSGDTLAFRPSRFANSYYWDFGNGQTSTDATPLTVYTADGFYTVTLIETFTCGSDTFTTIIAVDAPQAGFSISPATALTGSTIAFFNTTVGITPITYLWNFGDGNTSTDENPVHTYSEPGQYTACLIATNDCGSDTFCLPITVTNNFQKTYGGVSNDHGQNLTVTRENDMILSGYSTSFGLSGDNIMLVKTNAAGTVQWTKVYSGINSKESNSVQQANDGGFILCGRTFSFGAGNSDVIVVKTDTAGTIQWAKTYGSAVADYGRIIRPAIGSGYILTGVTTAGGLGGSNILIIKIDDSGNILWQKAYGGFYGELPYYLEPTTGGYVIVGYRHDYVPEREIFLLKIDTSGNPLWMQAYKDGQWNIGQGVDEIKFVNLNDRRAMPRTVGYLVAGYTTSFGAGAEDIFAMQTDTLGNIQWVKTYGGTGMDITRSVRQIGGGYYLIGGYTSSFGNGNTDIYLLEIDSSGTLLWSSAFGGASNDMQMTLATDDIMQFTPDRAIALFSSTTSFGAGASDMYLVKTNLDDTVGCNVVFNPATVTGIATLTATAVTPSVANLSLSVTSPALTETSPTITETLVCPTPAFSAKKGNSGEEDNRDISSSSTLLTEPNITQETINSKPKAINPEPQTSNVSVFPNPSTGELNIVYSLSGNEKAEFAVYDIIGKKLQQYELPADKTVYTISDLKLENGVYFYNAYLGHENIVGRIVLIQ